MTYSMLDTPTVLVDHVALVAMSDRIRDAGAPTLLVGWGEYAKHLINHHTDKIVAVCDGDPRNHGMSFRGVRVIAPHEPTEAKLIVACEYKDALGLMRDVVRRHSGIPYFIANQLHYKPTVEINAFEQEAIYQKLFRAPNDAPVSMMAMEKVKFLMEMLRLGLTFPGDVVEMGCWQGGSTWYMARLLKLLGERRRLYAMDLFETHMMDPTATMCNDEIRRKLDAEYENCEMVVGLIDDPAGLARIPGAICFAHFDLGPAIGGLEFLWERLSPGAPVLLDNYGHIAAPPWDFDAFFEARGTRVTRLPWSEQGLVFKRA